MFDHVSPCMQPEALFGRDQLLLLLDRLLSQTGRNRVVVLRGDDGSGKTAVAIAAAARWRQRGGATETMGLIGPLGPGPTAARLVVADQPDAASPQAWTALLGSLRPQDRLLLVSRTAIEVPVDDARLVELRVTPLSWDDSVELLAREGVPAEDRPPLVRWAEGRPLLLVLGAQAKLQSPGWVPGDGEEPVLLTERLGRRLGFAVAPAEVGRVREIVTASAGHQATVAAAEQAVRDYRSPDRLAANPLAVGPTCAARVADLRARIDAVIATSFGSAPRDVALRQVLTAGYVDGLIPHERIAEELFLSRSTYFRHLATALRRVAAGVAEAGAAARAPQVASAIASPDRELMLSLS